jgi:hypothetical protein
MLICLYGADTYRRDQKLKGIVASFKKKCPAVPIARLGDADTVALATFRTNTSLFETTRFGIVTVEKESAELKKELQNFLENTSVTLVVIAEKKPAKTFAFLLKEPVLAQEFALPKATELYAFIKQEAAARAVTLTPELLRSLAEAYGADTWALATELDKLALGASFSGNATIPDFFPLVQRLKGTGSPESKLVTLSYLLERDDPAAIFNVTAALMGDAAGKKKMADLDVAIKSGKLEYEEALVKLVIG